MPHLRRQPNSHDLPGHQGGTAAGNLRAQFQTPPSRQTPSNPTQHPPSTGAGSDDITPAPMGAAAHPAEQSRLFSLFGRQRLEQQQRPGAVPGPAPVEVEDVFDVDYEPDPQEFGQDEDEDEDEDDEGGPDDQFVYEEGLEEDEIDEEVEVVEEQFEDADEEMHDRERSPSPLPPNLREISSLASWTVSTSKPGCGVAALRHPSPTQYWQSDGPQPHTLSLHFFKLVAIVRIRVYLDFELDESYTPTKMVFLAGMGGNDLVEFATWEGDGPCGWVDVPLEGVGGRNGGWVRDEAVHRKRWSKGGSRKTTTGSGIPRERGDQSQAGDTADEEHDETDSLNGDLADDHEDPYTGNVLKAMVIQMRVIENHQNGKDTHVRGFQVFACDDRRPLANAPSASADGRHRGHNIRRSVLGVHGLLHPDRHGSDEADANRILAASGLDEPDWMGEPVIR